MRNTAPTSSGPAWILPGDAEDELDRLLAAFSLDPSDEHTFGQIEVLLRGAGRWELADAPTPPGKRA